MKRNILPMGSYTDEDPLDFPLATHTDPVTGKTSVVGWCKEGQFIIYLGAPIGNNFSVRDFFLALYAKAKGTLTRSRGVHSISLNGRHKLLNANFYGKFRYWLFFLLMDDTVRGHILSDAKKFLWKRSPELDPKELGSQGRSHRWIAHTAMHRGFKRGGGGILHWDSHESAYLVRFVIRLLSPRKAPFTEIIQHWLGEPCSVVIHNLTRTQKNHILAKIPEGAKYVREAFKAFWKLGLKPTDNLLDKVKDPDFLAGMPLQSNLLFKLKALTRDPCRRFDISNGKYNHPAQCRNNACVTLALCNHHTHFICELQESKKREPS